MCHLFLICLFLAFLPEHSAFSIEHKTAYETELTEIDAGLANLRRGQAASASEVKQSLYLFYNRASLVGSPGDIKRAETEIETALKQFGPVPDLYLIRASLELKLHQIAEAKLDLARVTEGTVGSDVALLQADIALQEGRLTDASSYCQKSIQLHRTWDGLARLAYLKYLVGDFVAAEENYLAAESEITAKEMRSYAWVEVQSGLLEFNQGHHREARVHYERANKAYSGYWLVEGCLAEVDAAQGRFQPAIARYESLIARVPKPEIQQALGDLYVFMGKPHEAKPWHDKALDAYLESARHGEVHYYHHLAAFYADVCEDGAEAVKWARADLELRQNSAAFDALAWALYRNGQFTEALDTINKALSSGVQDAHLLFHAAMIHLASGRISDGRQLLKRAAEINPHYESFHVHR